MQKTFTMTAGADVLGTQTAKTKKQAVTLYSRRIGIPEAELTAYEPGDEGYPYSASEERAKYEAFIAAIDESVAGRDEYGGLAWHIGCSALVNAGDTAKEQGRSDDQGFMWHVALETARMCLDDWRGMYPQLINQ